MVVSKLSGLAVFGLSLFLGNAIARPLPGGNFWNTCTFYFNPGGGATESFASCGHNVKLHFDSGKTDLKPNGNLTREKFFDYYMGKNNIGTNIAETIGSLPPACREKARAAREVVFANVFNPHNAAIDELVSCVNSPSANPKCGTAEGSIEIVNAALNAMSVRRSMHPNVFREFREEHNRQVTGSPACRISN